MSFLIFYNSAWLEPNLNLAISTSFNNMSDMRLDCTLNHINCYW